ncbi:hypothetical protein Hthe01_21050 [Hydrogenophilus thermoluteolus]|nr:hypothetical protein Hthe01_21050 [Hydrogenophilus thermoluteolus]
MAKVGHFYMAIDTWRARLAPDGHLADARQPQGAMLHALVRD